MTLSRNLLSLSPAKSAAFVALTLLGWNARAALQPGATMTVPANGSGAPSASLAAPAAPEEDILDIRPPIHIPPSFPWLPAGAAALAAAGLGAGSWTLLRRSHRKQPYEIALENLEKTRPLMHSENAQPFSLAVSEIVRLFIEECHPVRAAHRTSDEFLHDLANLPDSPLAAHRETLAEFLRHCDLAKFARWSLSVPQMEGMLPSASAFVIAIGKPVTAKKPSRASTSAPAPITETAAASH